MRRVGDRRARVRLDVVGALWGTLETQKRAQVVDINDTGALLLSPVQLPLNTVHTLELTLEGQSLPQRCWCGTSGPAPEPAPTTSAWSSCRRSWRLP